MKDRTIVINGTSHSLTEDKNGSPLIDGMVLDEFMDTLSTEDLGWCAAYGMEIAIQTPYRLDDLLKKDIKKS